MTSSSVKRDVTDEMWAHACKELITNWNPDSVINRPIHIQALSYLYRQRDGAPAFDWGMKEEICKQFSLPANYGRAQLSASSESIAAGWGGQGLLDAERSGYDRQLPGSLTPASTVAYFKDWLPRGCTPSTSCAMVSTHHHNPNLASSSMASPSSPTQPNPTTSPSDASQNHQARRLR